MIGWLAGTVRDNGATGVVVEAGGVGYLVSVPPTLAGLTVGERAELWVHTHVREDALALYGFATRAERDLFVLLIGISGIGPKTALAVIALFPPDRLAAAVAAQDMAALTGVPGIGKKTAERLLLELRGRLAPAAGMPGAAPAAGAVEEGAVAALVALGFPAEEAKRAVAAVRDDVPPGDSRALVTAALRRLRK